MESTEVTTANFQKDEVWQAANYMQPILNIPENEGIYFYRFVILLKLLFVNYTMTSVLSKHVTLLLASLIGGCAYCIDSTVITPWIYPLIIAFAIHALPCFGQKFEIPTLILCSLSMNVKPCEFLLDVFVLCCIAYYSQQAYEGEIRKLCAMLILTLSLIWYIWDEQRMNTWNSNITVVNLCLLVSLYYPLKPSRESKYKYGLIYLYAIVFMVIFYKGYQLNFTTQVVPILNETANTPDADIYYTKVEITSETIIIPEEFLSSEITVNSTHVTQEFSTISSNADIYTNKVEPTSETINPEKFSNNDIITDSSPVTQELSTCSSNADICTSKLELTSENTSSKELAHISNDTDNTPDADIYYTKVEITSETIIIPEEGLNNEITVNSTHVTQEFSTISSNADIYTDKVELTLETTNSKELASISNETANTPDADIYFTKVEITSETVIIPEEFLSNEITVNSTHVTQEFSTISSNADIYTDKVELTSETINTDEFSNKIITDSSPVTQEFSTCSSNADICTSKVELTSETTNSDELFSSNEITANSRHVIQEFSTMSSSDADVYTKDELTSEMTNPEFLSNELITNSRHVIQEFYTQSSSNADVYANKLELISETAKLGDFSSNEIIEDSDRATREFSTESLQEITEVNQD